MLAIIQKGGKQYIVAKGQTIEVEKTEDKEGSVINLENVLLLGKDKDIKIGTPIVEGAYVSAKVLEHKKGDKIVIYKMKAKKRYQRKNGFRKSITKLEIVDIHATGGNTSHLKEKIVSDLEKPLKPKKIAAKTTTKRSSKSKISDKQSTLV